MMALYQVIMPLKHKSLPDLIVDLEKKNKNNSAASYTFLNTYFMDSMKLTDEEAKSLLPLKTVCSLFQGSMHSAGIVSYVIHSTVFFKNKS